jgi:hypothetical protein
VYLYLGKREFVQCDGVIEPINGILYVQVCTLIKKKRKFSSYMRIFRVIYEEGLPII